MSGISLSLPLPGSRGAVSTVSYRQPARQMACSGNKRPTREMLEVQGWSTTGIYGAPHADNARVAQKAVPRAGLSAAGEI